MRRAAYSYSMEQSPSWEANRFSASQEIPRILWNPKVHYRVHKCHLSPSWASSIQSMPPHPTPWSSILILFSHLRLGLPNGLSSLGFPTKTLHMPLLSPIRAICLAHLILLYFITRTIVGEESLSGATHTPAITLHDIMLRHKDNSVPKAKVNPNDELRM